MTDERNEEDRDESRRILKRISQEADGNGGSVIDRATSRARDHLAAADVDRSDWAEYWGTRIGRMIGAIFLVGLIVWLVFYLTRGN